MAWTPHTVANNEARIIGGIKLKKSILSVLLGSLMFTAFAAHAETKIGVTMVDYNDTFRTLLRDGIAAAAKKSGMVVAFEDAKSDVGTQLGQIQNMIAGKFDAIIVQAVDTDATPKITQLVSAAKIPLIYVNLKPSDFEKLPATATVVASDEMVGGTLQAKQVCDLLGGKGNVLVLMGDLAHEAARTRTKAVEDTFKTKECAGMTILDKREGKWSRINGQDITLNWISTNMKFDAIIANNDEMALGAINALKSTKTMKPTTVVAGIDATTDALAAMKAGDLKVTVFQNAKAQGQGAIDAAMKLINKEPVERFVNVPFELVTPANMSKYATPQ